MNVQCPSCSTTFRVDPAKVPAGGVRARCSVCAAVFPVSVAPAAAAPLAARPADPHRCAATTAAASRADTGDPGTHAAGRSAGSATGGHAGDATASAVVVARSAGDPRRASSAAAPAHHAAAAAGGAATSGGGWAVGQSVPVAGPVAQGAPTGAGPGVRHGGLPSGEAARCAQGRDVKESFKEEITKSWEEYVDQVGRELADSTPYFREALNEILGDGSPIF